MNNKYNYLFKSSNKVNALEGEKIYELASRMYPDFIKYFEKNRFYSSVKPQLVILVYEGKKLIAEGKLLWRIVKLRSDKTIKFFVYGLTVDSKYQKQGIGTRILDMSISKAKELGADLLYGCTTNPHAMKMMKRKGFKRLTTQLIYTEALIQQMTKEADPSYGLEFKQGIIDEINHLPELYLGIGPL